MFQQDQLKEKAQNDIAKKQYQKTCILSRIPFHVQTKQANNRPLHLNRPSLVLQTSYHDFKVQQL